MPEGSSCPRLCPEIDSSGIAGHCCIEPMGVLATAQSSKAGSAIPAGTTTNRAFECCRGASGRADETSSNGPIAQCLRRCPQEGFSAARRSTNRRSSGAVRRPPLRWPWGWVQRRFTRSRCHRKIVAGRRSDAIGMLRTAIGAAPPALPDPPRTVAVC